MLLNYISNKSKGGATPHHQIQPTKPNKMKKQSIIKVIYIIQGLSYEANFIMFEGDKLEKMLPAQAIIVSVIEVN